jgi:hypothetical protein
MPANSLFDESLSDWVNSDVVVTAATAESLFAYFWQSPLFRWQDANNDCEDRANAACMLLDQWRVPNYKAWVFGGQYLRRGYGNLINFWNYHVATCLPVMVDHRLQFLVLDPATLSAPATIEQWAEGVTGTAFSYHLVKRGDYYIFPSGDIQRDNWHRRDRRNYKWTIQGLSGINGVSRTGKAQVMFHKARIQKVEREFRKLWIVRPEIPGIDLYK